MWTKPYLVLPCSAQLDFSQQMHSHMVLDTPLLHHIYPWGIASLQHLMHHVHITVLSTPSQNQFQLHGRYTMNHDEPVIIKWFPVIKSSLITCWLVVTKLLIITTHYYHPVMIHLFMGDKFTDKMDDESLLVGDSMTALDLLRFQEPNSRRETRNFLRCSELLWLVRWRPQNCAGLAQE